MSIESKGPEMPAAELERIQLAGERDADNNPDLTEMGRGVRRDGYEKGAIAEYLRAHSSQAGQVRWVKASERLPEDDTKTYFCKRLLGSCLETHTAYSLNALKVMAKGDETFVWLEEFPLQPSEPSPSPEQPKGEIPEDLKEWIDNHAECDSDEDATLWINGATAMYRKLANDNDFFDSQIADYSRTLSEELRSLQSELSTLRGERDEYRSVLENPTMFGIKDVLAKHPSSSTNKIANNEQK